MRIFNIWRWMVLIVCMVLISIVINAGAADKKDLEGWGLTDLYNQFYDAEDIEDTKVVVLDIKQIVPIPGMSPAVAMVVQDGDDEILVHVCPVWYKKPEKIGVRKGDKIKLRGHYTEIDGKDVIMALKIKNKGKSFKVRLTSDGTPFWTMSPGRLQKELSAQ